MTVLSAQTIEQRVEVGRKTKEAEARGGTYTSTVWGPVTVRKILPMLIEPFESKSRQACGMSYGLTGAGYDIRIGKLQTPANRASQVDNPQAISLKPGEFMLAASLERFELPNDIQAIVHDKSTLARQGVALQNTVLEPGWEGFITLELSNHGPKPVRILVGQPIAQVVFHLLDAPTEKPYRGKYQNQDNLPTEAKFVDDVQVDDVIDDKPVEMDI